MKGSPGVLTQRPATNVLPRVAVVLPGWRSVLRGIAVLARLALGAVFVWSSLWKFEQPYDFLSAVYNYELVGPRLGLFIASTLPWLELVLGVSLVTAVFSRGSLIVAALLFSVFGLAQVSVLNRSLRIPCGCAGNQGGILTPSDLWRTLFLLLVALLALGCSAWLEHSRQTAADAQEQPTAG